MNKHNHQSPVLCKYLGLTECGEDGPRRKVRLYPFTQGTFRATPPSALNDVLSETKCLAYFNEFSPSDLHVTKQDLQLRSITGEEPSENLILRELKGSHNFPRYTPDKFPDLFDGDIISKEEFEYDEFLQIITRINRTLINSVSRQFGVLSLAQNCLDPLMWCHYSENGRSVCIEFDPENAYFTENTPKPVSYTPDDRLHFSYFEGIMRINGLLVWDNLPVKEQEQRLIKDWPKYFSEEQCRQATLYSKSESWAYENEMRIAYPFSTCKLIKRNQLDFIANPSTSIYCTEIPFSAFKSVYLGYAISSEDREAVINEIKKNSELSHVAVFDVYACPSGVLRTKEVSLATTQNIKS